MVAWSLAFECTERRLIDVDASEVWQENVFMFSSISRCITMYQDAAINKMQQSQSLILAAAWSKKGAQIVPMSYMLAQFES